METQLPARLTAAEGRRFALTVGAAFLVLAGITWWRGHGTLMAALSGVGGLLLVAGLLIPGRLGPVYRWWMAFALLISKFTTPVLMAVVYFVVILAIGVLMRMAGRNPLRHRASDNGYWVTRAEGAGRRSDLERQF